VFFFFIPGIGAFGRFSVSVIGHALGMTVTLLAGISFTYRTVTKKQTSTENSCA
jgi:hypothetical protein